MKPSRCLMKPKLKARIYSKVKFLLKIINFKIRIKFYNKKRICRIKMIIIIINKMILITTIINVN